MKTNLLNILENQAQRKYFSELRKLFVKVGQNPNYSGIEKKVIRAYCWHNLIKQNIINEFEINL